MFNNRYLFSYERASLPLKISLPFIAMFLVLGVVGTVVFGQRFSNQLDREQREKAEELAALVKRDIDRELEDLRKNARLLTAQETIVESASAQNRIKLQQRILPLKAVLKTDIITIINPKKDILLNVKTNELQNKELMYETAVELLIEGSGLHTVVASSDSGPPILIGTAPLKNEQNIIGGIIVGTVVSDTLLAQISESINVQIVAIYEEKIVASALPIAPGDAASLSSITSQSPVVLGAKEFIAEPVNLNSLDEQQFRLIILVSRQPFVAAKQNLWLSILTVAFIGSVMVALAGYWIARKIAEPIQKITHTARKVVKDNDFNLRAEVATEDEIGTLANSLNQLIGWVEQYTHELEVAGQTLEDRVYARTNELSETLHKLKETQSQLIQTEKMSSLGQMVAGVAHEINNPLSFIQGNLFPLNVYFKDLVDLLETYQKEYPKPTEAILNKQAEIDIEFIIRDLVKLLDSMKVGSERVHEIVVSLRNYSRLDEAAIKDVDIHEGIDGTLLLLNHRIKQGVQVTKSYGLLPQVRCSPAQLNQVFTNIVSNALDAMLDCDRSPKQLTIKTQAVGYDRIQVSIQDTGPGIPHGIKDKIFDPFFTTKGIGKGTGLGLGICFHIIQRHQGSIEVNSEVGAGTEFLITLKHDSDLENSILSKPLDDHAA